MLIKQSTMGEKMKQLSIRKLAEVLSIDEKQLHVGHFMIANFRDEADIDVIREQYEKATKKPYTVVTLCEGYGYRYVAIMPTIKTKEVKKRGKSARAKRT